MDQKYEKMPEDGETSQLVGKGKNSRVEELKKRVKKQNWAIFKSKLAVNPAKTLSGYQKWRYSVHLSLKRFRIRVHESTDRLKLWGSSFKSIEGHYGTGVLSYFRFLRWLFTLNLLISIMVFCFIVIPQITADWEQEILMPFNQTTDRLANSTDCESRYLVEESSGLALVIDFIQGTGWMEKTLMFYGYYTDLTLSMDRMFGDGSWFDYNMPLAYLLVAVGYFAISLIMMFSHTSETLREQLLHGHEWAQSRGFLSVAFSGWDYALTEKDAAMIRHKQIFNEIMSNLDEQRQRMRRQGRTTMEKVQLYFLRFFIWLLVLTLLGVSGYLIAIATETSTQHTGILEADHNHTVIEQLFYEYIPSITLTALNFAIPKVFKFMVGFEDYNTTNTMTVTLIRTVFLRVSSLCVLLATLYNQITCKEVNDCNVGLGGNSTCPDIWCWETYVGQNMYRLIVMVVVVLVGTIFLVELPRKIVVTYMGHYKYIKMVGFPTFDIPKNVLDLIYLQILIWIGTFFAPLLATMAAMILFVAFYLKKLSVMHNHVPDERPYRATRSHVSFMIILIVSYLLCCIPIGFAIAHLEPSLACGPFRLYDNMWEAWTSSVVTWPSLIQDIVGYMTSAGFIIPLILVMSITIYIYSAASKGKSELIVKLQENLSLSSKDQMYLLNRLNELEGEGGRRGPGTVLPSERNTQPAAEEGNASYNTFE